MRNNSEEIRKIVELIKQFKETGEQEVFNCIYKKLEPLLKKYAKKLYNLEYDDAIQELGLALYKAILEIKYLDNEYASFAYIENCLFHSYCNLIHSMKNQVEECYENVIDMEENKNEYSLEDAIYCYDFINSKLTKKEKKILLMSFYGYSDKEIGAIMGVSR